MQSFDIDPRALPSLQSERQRESVCESEDEREPVRDSKTGKLTKK